MRQAGTASDKGIDLFAIAWPWMRNGKASGNCAGNCESNCAGNVQADGFGLQRDPPAGVSSTGMLRRFRESGKPGRCIASRAPPPLRGLKAGPLQAG